MPAQARAAAPRCVVCGKPADESSVGFTAAGSRPLFWTCAPHAEVVRTGVSEAAKLAAAGVRTLIDARFPGLRRKLRKTAQQVRAMQAQAAGATSEPRGR
jgi:hypothetical protein